MTTAKAKVNKKQSSSVKRANFCFVRNKKKGVWEKYVESID